MIMKKHYKVKWGNLIALLVLVYMIVGTLSAAYDSHINPEKHAYCVENEVCGGFWGYGEE